MKIIYQLIRFSVAVDEKCQNFRTLFKTAEEQCSFKAHDSVNTPKKMFSCEFMLLKCQSHLPDTFQQIKSHCRHINLKKGLQVVMQKCSEAPYNAQLCVCASSSCITWPSPAGRKTLDAKMLSRFTAAFCLHIPVFFFWNPLSLIQ